MHSCADWTYLCCSTRGVCDVAECLWKPPNNSLLRISRIAGYRILRAHASDRRSGSEITFGDATFAHVFCTSTSINQPLHHRKILNLKATQRSLAALATLPMSSLKYSRARTVIYIKSTLV